MIYPLDTAIQTLNSRGHFDTDSYNLIPECQVIPQKDFHARPEIWAAGLSPLSEGSFSNDGGDGNESGKKKWVCLFCSG